MSRYASGTATATNRGKRRASGEAAGDASAAWTVVH